VGRPAIADFGFGLARWDADAAPVGAAAAVAAAQRTLAGEVLEDAEAAAFWSSLREQTHAFFAGDAPLWRLSLPSVAPPQALGPTLIEWGGAQRWLRAGDARAIRAAAHKPAVTRRCFALTTP
jgi:glycolate oxidase FAD binding subunit